MNKKDKTVLDLSIYVTFNNKTVTLNDLFNELLTELEDSKNRIDKAIEYIEQYEDRFKNCLASDLEFNVYEVLSILRGEE